MKRPPLPCLLLLPLLAVLLFGNCGGGVRGILSSISPKKCERMCTLVLQRQAERAAAKQKRRGWMRTTKSKKPPTPGLTAYFRATSNKNSGTAAAK